ncbi:MAG: peptide chain release factor N(5)-glutamine methyltransferase [Terracidiphilus sp.]
MTTTPKARPTLHLALDAGEKLLAEGPHPTRARRDAETLLLHVLRQTAPEVNLAWLIAHDGDALAPEQAAVFCDAIERRLAGEPIQYITGEAEFYGLSFHLNRDVLIPRPETELLVEKAIAFVGKLRQTNEASEPRIVDVGTGSGAIAVALAHALPFAEIAATDISAPAIAVARSNAARNGLADRIRFLEGDLLAPVAGEQFDLIVSNPPYVAEGDRAALDIEVRNYEPAQALFAGGDGLAIYRRLIPASFTSLAAGGILLLEIGYGQREAIDALLEICGFKEIEFFSDLQGIPRVAKAPRIVSKVRQS